nr:MAG TPA: hypothetical protein [Microviridae sp.]
MKRLFLIFFNQVIDPNLNILIFKVRILFNLLSTV